MQVLDFIDQLAICIIMDKKQEVECQLNLYTN